VSPAIALSPAASCRDQVTNAVSFSAKQFGGADREALSEHLRGPVHGGDDPLGQDPLLERSATPGGRETAVPAARQLDDVTCR
jgi:hypothetical protein